MLYKVCLDLSLNLQNYIEDALRDLVPLVQFKKCEKHSRRRVAFRALQIF